MKFIKFLFTLVILLTISFSVIAQDPLGGRDLTNFKADALSESQITAIQGLAEWTRARGSRS